MLIFILGAVLMIFISSIYKKKLINSVLLILLFILVTFILNSTSFKSSYKYAYELVLFLSVLFLHTFQMLSYPLVVKFVLRKSMYIGHFTKGFICVGTGGSIFILYMFFVRGVIYD